VVSIESHRSFVIADIPGLIEGAAEGAGLGIQFLKHVSRTLLLLHLVDVSPFDGSDPVESVRIIERELAKFSDELVQRERWLVLNKVDLLPEDERDAICDDIVKRLDWQGPVFRTAALASEGTQRLTQEIMKHMELQREESAREA
jgi:GTPase